jgi:hypothetical protein
MHYLPFINLCNSYFFQEGFFGRSLVSRVHYSMLVSIQVFSVFYTTREICCDKYCLTGCICLVAEAAQDRLLLNLIT